MDGLKLCRGLLIDRYYRGAIVMTDIASFVLAEPLVQLIERVQNTHGRFVPDAEDRVAIAALVARGILEGSTP